MAAINFEQQEQSIADPFRGYRTSVVIGIILCIAASVLFLFDDDTTRQIAELDDARSALINAATEAQMAAESSIPRVGFTAVELQQSVAKIAAEIAKLENDRARSLPANSQSDSPVWQPEPWLDTAKLDAEIKVHHHLLARATGQLEFSRFAESTKPQRTGIESRIRETTDRVTSAQSERDAVAQKLSELNSKFVACSQCVAIKEELDQTIKDFNAVCKRYPYRCRIPMTDAYNSQIALSQQIDDLKTRLQQTSNGLSSQISQVSDQLSQVDKHTAQVTKERNDATAALAEMQRNLDAARVRIPDGNLALTEVELSELTRPLDEQQSKLESLRESHPTLSHWMLAGLFGALLAIVGVLTFTLRLGKGTLRRCAVLIALLFALVLAWQPSLDYPAAASVDSGAKRAFAAFAIARSLNAFVSLAQGTQFTPPIIGSFSFSVGEFLDPANDLIEDFSNVMLAATVAFGIQKLLLVIGQYWVVKWLLVGVAFLWAAFFWSTDQVPRRITQLMLLMLMVRFAVPLVTLGTDTLYEQLLQAKYTRAHASLELESRNLESEVTTLQSSDADSHGFLERINPVSYFHRIKDIVDRSITHAVDVMAVFALQTVFVPLLLLWLLYATLRAILLRPGSG